MLAMNNRILSMSLLVLTLLIVTSQRSQAKLSAATDDDGRTDPETEAAVNALNEALEPPEPGESDAEWYAELQLAYENLHGVAFQGEPVDWPDPGEAEPTSTVIDMCDSPFAAWVEATSANTVRQELPRSGNEAAIADALEPILEIQANNAAFYYQDLTFSSVRVDDIACAPAQDAELRLTLSFRYGLLSLGVSSGTIEVDATAFYRETPMPGFYDIHTGEPSVWRERCVVPVSHELRTDFITKAIIGNEISNVLTSAEFCVPALND